MSEEWMATLRLRLEDFIDTFVVAGAKQTEVLDAISREIVGLRRAYAQDPDPAEDDGPAIDDPANDWPAADPT